jgi:hypothetical protein
MAANVLARKQRGLIAVLRRAVDNAQDELEALEREDDEMQFTPTEPSHLVALKEWSCSYPTFLRGHHCGNCGGPFELDRNAAIAAQYRIIRAAEEDVRERQRQLSQLQKRLSLAQKYEEEDMDMPLAQRMKMKPAVRLQREQLKAGIARDNLLLPQVKAGLESAEAALPALVEPAKKELQRLRVEVMMYKQEHWPVFAVSALAPEEGASLHGATGGRLPEADGYICMDCACNPLVAYDYKAYMKASYKVPDHVKERWFAATVPKAPKAKASRVEPEEEPMEDIPVTPDTDDELVEAPMVPKSLVST